MQLAKRARALGGARRAGREGDVAALLTMLRSSSREERAEAASALGKSESSAESVRELARVAASDDEPIVRREAVRTLGRVAAHDDDVCRVLISVLADSDHHSRMNAAEALGRIRCRHAVDPLGSKLEPTHNVWMRIYAAQALADIRHRSAIPMLHKAILDEDRRVFREGLRGIRELLDGSDQRDLKELEASLSWWRRRKVRRLRASITSSDDA